MPRIVKAIPTAGPFTSAISGFGKSINAFTNTLELINKVNQI
jgi:hypothetical protein